jgi:hypothetical protein
MGSNTKVMHTHFIVIGPLKRWPPKEFEGNMVECNGAACCRIPIPLRTWVCRALRSRGSGNRPAIEAELGICMMIICMIRDTCWSCMATEMYN